MGQGQGSFQTNPKFPPGGSPGPPFLLNSADNGLSVDPISKKIVLGQSIGALGNPAILLDNREIPFAGFTLDFIDAGPTQIRFNPSIPEIRIIDNLLQNSHLRAHELFMQGSPNGQIALDLNPSPFLSLQGNLPGVNPKVIWDFQIPGNQYTAESDELATGSFSIGSTNNLARTVYDDTVQSFDFRAVGNRYLSLSAVFQGYLMGDIDNANKSSRVAIDDSIPAVFIAMQLNNYLNLDNSTRVYEMGDLGAVLNGSKVRINDTASTFQLITTLGGNTVEINGDATVPGFVVNLNSNGYLVLDHTANTYKLGDTTNSTNGTQLTVDDGLGKFFLTNATLTAIVNINGTDGFTGTVANPVTITVNGGIVTNVA